MTDFFDSIALSTLTIERLPLDVEIEGTIRVQGDRIWLQVNDEGEFLLQIDDSSLKRRLLESVPCYVGGQYLYNDSAIIEATLAIKNGNISISHVKSGKIWQEDGDEYDF